MFEPSCSIRGRGAVLIGGCGAIVARERLALHKKGMRRRRDKKQNKKYRHIYIYSNNYHLSDDDPRLWNLSAVWECSS